MTSTVTTTSVQRPPTGGASSAEVGAATGTPATAAPGTAADPGAPAAPVLDLRVRTGTVRRWLGAVLALLVLANLGASVAEGNSWLPDSLTRFFDGDEKVNLPTGYKVTLLLASTVLLAVRSVAARRAGERLRSFWVLLTVLVGLAFLDETTYFHQTLTTVLQRHTGLDHGVFRFGWAWVYLPAVVVVGVVVVRYLLALPAGLRNRLVLVAVLYVGGSLGLEPVKSEISEGGGTHTLKYQLAAWVSDSAEMIGLFLLVLTLLAELARVVAAVSLHLRDDRPTAG